MNKIEIKRKLKKVFERRFQLRMDNLSCDIYDLHFFGKPLNLTPGELIYIFFDIEKEFQITLPQEDIAFGKFSNFNNVVDIIYNQFDINESQVK